MEAKRYSVFISSTYEDLKDERQSVQDVIISAGDFPVQMESFPAADEDQFAFIRTLIDKCDYYVLIIAGRYGRPTEDGTSYTEKEYRYAVQRGIPVLVMLHGDRGSIATSRSEDTASGRKRLADFIAITEEARLRKTWRNREGLQLAVREALDHAKATKPRIGWVRGDTIATVAALEELNEVRKENAKFRDAIGNLEIELALPAIPAADSSIEIDLIPSTMMSGEYTSRSTYARVRCTWVGIFPIFHRNFITYKQYHEGVGSYYINEDDTCSGIGNSVAEAISPFEGTLYSIGKGTLDRLMSYYIEVGLMNADGEEAFTDAAKRVARRHSIVGALTDVFEVTNGKVSVESKKTDPGKRSDMDDEIPF